MASPIKIAGRQGRHDLINGTYEPIGQQHQNNAVYISRAVQPVYLFHTGKSRWVISKRLDDGQRCFAFVNCPSGTSPDKAQGPWSAMGDDNEWGADRNISCTAGLPSHDKFLQLRMTLDAEMAKLGIHGDNPAELKKLWKVLDYNGNNIVSLAEIDKMVVEKVASNEWPAWLNNKPALMRAYKKTILKDGNGDDWVQKSEFHALLLNIFWFNKLWQVFDAIDGDDRRIDVGEFCSGMSRLGLQLSRQDAEAEFAKIDSNHGGQVLFVEFCAYIRKRVNPDANPAFDNDIVSGEHCGKVLRKHHGHKATHTHMVTKKCLAEFDKSEKQVQAIMADNAKLKELWQRIDFNGNNIVSLAEIDKLAVEKYPLLNHKPALMRAYKASIKSVKADAWVEKKEFKTLLANMFYFNKLFWLFDYVDKQADHYGDRRLDYNEFKKMIHMTVGNAMSEQEIRSDFQKVDRNGGGQILFDEFCAYFTMKSCPQALQAFTD